MSVPVLPQAFRLKLNACLLELVCGWRARKYNATRVVNESNIHMLSDLSFAFRER